MFAVVKITGKQYVVSPDLHVDVDRMPGNEGDTITLTDVLLRDTGTNITVGEPYIKNAKVTATIEKQFQGDKINVRRYKSKVRYRKSTGFRAQLTRLHITDIA